MIHFLPISAFVLYVLCAVIYVFNLCGIRRSWQPLCQWLYHGAFILHTFSLITFLLDSRLFMMERGGDYFFWLSWLIGVSYYLVWQRMDSPTIGALTTSGAALFMLSSSYLVHLEGGSLAGRSPALLVGVHVLPALLAEACLAVAFVVSLTFLVQQRRLKEKKGGVLLISGPSLSYLENCQTVVVTVGFVAMTVAVLSGSVWALSTRQAILRGDFRIVMALATWTVLAGLLHLKLAASWSAKDVSKATLVVGVLFFVSLLLALIARGNVLHGAL